MNKAAKNYAKKRSQKTASKWVKVNDKGYPIGEGHPRAKTADHDVELVVRLHEEGMAVKLIARKMGIPRRTVRDYVGGRTRGQCGVRKMRGGG